MDDLITKINEMDDKVLINDECQVAVGFLHDQVITQPVEFYSTGNQKIDKNYFEEVS